MKNNSRIDCFALPVSVPTSERLGASERRVGVPWLRSGRSFTLRGSCAMTAPGSACAEVPWKRGPQGRGLFKPSEHPWREEPRCFRCPRADGRGELGASLVSFPGQGLLRCLSIDHGWKAEGGPCRRARGWSAEPLPETSGFTLCQMSRTRCTRRWHPRTRRGAGSRGEWMARCPAVQEELKDSFTTSCCEVND